MKKLLYSTISLVLICCVLCTFSFDAAAEEEYLGTEEDITGYIVQEEDDDISLAAIGSGIFEDHFPIDGMPEVFSIRAEHVTSLLTSNDGEKSFSITTLPSNSRRIVCKATLNHSIEDEFLRRQLHEYMVIGVCYYGYQSPYGDCYISVYSMHMPQGGYGNLFEGDFIIEDTLVSNETYYSYIKNKYEAGYVYGRLTLYASSTLS